MDKDKLIEDLKWQVEQARNSIKFGKTLEECHTCKRIGCDDVIRYCEDCDNYYCENCLEEFSNGTHTEDGFQDDDFAICKQCAQKIREKGDKSKRTSEFRPPNCPIHKQNCDIVYPPQDNRQYKFDCGCIQYNNGDLLESKK